MPTITVIVVRSRLSISAVRSASVHPEVPRVSHEKVECSYDAPTPDVAAPSSSLFKIDVVFLSYSCRLLDWK